MKTTAKMLPTSIQFKVSHFGCIKPRIIKYNIRRINKIKNFQRIENSRFVVLVTQVFIYFHKNIFRVCLSVYNFRRFAAKQAESNKKVGK